jgi:hypothetical protein
VNKGVISADDLIVINGSVSLVPVPDSTDFVEFSQRYHPQYPGVCVCACVCVCFHGVRMTLHFRCVSNACFFRHGSSELHSFSWFNEEVLCGNFG